MFTYRESRLVPDMRCNTVKVVAAEREALNVLFVLFVLRISINFVNCCILILFLLLFVIVLSVSGITCHLLSLSSEISNSLILLLSS